MVAYEWLDMLALINKNTEAAVSLPPTPTHIHPTGQLAAGQRVSAAGIVLW